MDDDDFMDGVNEYDLLYGYIHDLGLVSQNQLSFNGNVELAMKYDEASLPDMSELYSPFDFKLDCDATDYSASGKTNAFNLENNHSLASDEEKSEATIQYISSDSKFIIDSDASVKISHNTRYDNGTVFNSFGTQVEEVGSSNLENNIRSDNISNNCFSAILDFNAASDCSNNSANNVKPEVFPLARYSPKIIPLVTTFQLPKETRMKYLLRYPKLYQEFYNSGQLEKIKILHDDVFTKDMMHITKLNPPIVGREKIYHLITSMCRNIPDYCVFYNNIHRTKHRIIIMKGNSIGTLPYVSNSVTDKSTTLWNSLEHASVEKFDEHHKLLKQKYDTLKSQKKDIKFERRATWYFMLDKNLQHYEKMMATNEMLDIFDF